MATFELDEAAFQKANELGRQRMAAGPLATEARYENGRIHVELNNGCAFDFPADRAEGLAGASVADLSVIVIEGLGLSLHWPKLDADLSVRGLSHGVFGSRRWMAELGAVGGKAKTEKKALSSRANGALGGRPRKAAAPAGSGKSGAAQVASTKHRAAARSK